VLFKPLRFVEIERIVDLRMEGARRELVVTWREER
jgi:hypothetical protein